MTVDGLTSTVDGLTSTDQESVLIRSALMHFPIEFYRIGSLFAHTGVASWWPLKSMQI